MRSSLFGVGVMFWKSAALPDSKVSPRFAGALDIWRYLESEIAYLIIATDHHVVFIDKDLDVDWETAEGETSQQDSTDSADFNGILNRVAALEATPSDELRPTMKLQFKRLLGEGVARALDEDYEGARAILDEAHTYITARSQEASRSWYLSASGIVTVPFLLVGLFSWIFRDSLRTILGATVFWLVISACAGAAGALLSVIWRTGKQQFDSSAGRHLHYLEAASRICAGAISGILVGAAVQAQLFLTALIHNGNMPMVMMLSALASGSSERLATSIMADLSNTRKQNNADGRD